MKKLSAILLCMALVVSGVVSVYAFPDLAENHWAYSSVEKMVNDGRVNGFPDGEFKPNELVTRWQFAKMTGGNPDEISFPDRAATRDEAVDYLWNFNGKPEAIAPSAVTKGSSNPNAVAWAYARGIMMGDDGINLRLDSTLTRAEAAALIVRSEGELGTVDFKSAINPLILERFWNTLDIEIPYTTGNLTGGQLSRIALKIQHGTDEILYKDASFEGEYANDVQLVAEECLGTDYATADFMNRPATVQEMVAVLSYYAMRTAAGNIKFGDGSTYTDVSLSNPKAQMGLKFAKNNGIMLYSEPKLNANDEATIQETACVLVQLDEVIGLTKAYGTKEKRATILKSAEAWPANEGDYAHILSDVPVDVYQTPIADGYKPADFYQFGLNYGSVLANFLSQVSDSFPKGVRVEWTVWPSCVVRTDKEVIIRAGLEIKTNEERVILNKLLPNNSFTEEYLSNWYIVDISTTTPVMDVVLDGEKYHAIRAFSI